MSYLNYADDVLNLSRTISGIEVIFSECRKIGLEFNAEKSEVVSIGMPRNRPIPEIVCLEAHPVKLSPSTITLEYPLEYPKKYLGLPIGSALKHTLEFLAARLRKAYGLLVLCKARYNRRVISKIYNVFSVSHLLALSPFWNIFITSDKGACQ